MWREYNSRTTGRARRERRLPAAEGLLWTKLSDRQIDDLRFQRRYCVGPYTIDFCCPAIGLGVEVDGDRRADSSLPVNEHRRQSYIEENGIRLLRVSSRQVYHDLNGVVELITQVARQMADEPAEGTEAAEGPKSSDGSVGSNRWDR